MSTPSKILVLSPDDDIAVQLRDALGTEAAAIESVPGTLSEVNGRAVELVARHDLVVFDADPDDESTLAAIAELSAKRNGKPMVAMIDGEVSLAKARRLQALGVDDVIPRGIDRVELGQALRQHLSEKTRAGGRAAEGTVFAVAQARGGIGATTLAVNLAEALARQKGRKAKKPRVVLFDLDLQYGNASVFLDIEDNGALMQLCSSGQPPDSQFVHQMVQHHASGIDIINAPTPLAPLDAMRPGTLAVLLDLLRAEYDYVVVDLPRAMVDWIEPVIARTGRLFVVTDTSVPCIRQAQRMLEFYRENNFGLAVSLVVNRERRPMLGSEHIRQAEAALGSKFEYWLPDDPKRARRAVDLGAPVVARYPHSDLGRAYLRLAQKTSAQHAASVTANL